MVITISRQDASGGDEISLKVAEKLSYCHINKELISAVAKQANVPESEIEAYDDRVESPIYNFLSKLYSADKYIDYLTKGVHLEREDFIAFITETMLDLYQYGDVVIVGRGGQAILQNKSGVVHIRIVAPFEYRSRRLAENIDLSIYKADDILREMDEERSEFLEQSFDIKPYNPSLYHLIINTAKVNEALAVDVITNLVLAMEEKL